MIKDIHSEDVSNALKKGFQEGKTLSEMLELCSGQECVIFKAREFVRGDEIIYIPDLWLNDIPESRPVLDPIQQNEILLSCYTGDDFIAVCEGDEEKAHRLFAYCDWQHPTSAYNEGANEGAVDDDNNEGDDEDTPC